VSRSEAREPLSLAADGIVAWLQLPFEFDAAPLVEDVRTVEPEWWIAHFNSRDYAGQWDVAPLRSRAGAEHPVLMAYSDPTATEWVDTPLLGSCPAIKKVISKIQCPVRSARLLRLASGSEILEHTDYDLGYEDGEVRLHVPIETSPEVEFRLNGRCLEMRAGEMWYLNVNRVHSVANRSEAARTHLVLDCVVNDWFRSVFESAKSNGSRGK